MYHMYIFVGQQHNTHTHIHPYIHTHSPTHPHIPPHTHTHPYPPTQEKNQQLARRTAKLSEDDFEQLRGEFEERLAAAERKCYALTKERDALRRGTEKLSSANELLKVCLVFVWVFVWCGGVGVCMKKEGSRRGRGCVKKEEGVWKKRGV